MVAMFTKTCLETVGCEQFSSLCDDRLLKEVKEGNPEALECLFYRYLGFARKIASSYFLIGAENDDLLQEASIGLFKAILDYEQGKSCSFKSYAALCIKRNIITAIRKLNRHKHEPLNNYISFNFVISEEKNDIFMDSLEDESALNPEKMAITKEKYESIVVAVDEHLSNFEKKVLFYHIKGLSYAQISSNLSKNEKSVDNALQRIKKKMKNKFEF